MGENPLLDAKPVSAAIDFWTSEDSCDPTPMVQFSPDHNVYIADYNSCASGNEVQLFTVTNGKHEWPTEANNGFSATGAILDFFSRHSKN